MATQQGIEGLLRVIAAEATEALGWVASGRFAEADATTRNLEDDVERLRQEMNALLAGGEAVKGAKGAKSQ